MIGKVNNGEEAVNLYRTFSNKPEIILMDHRMPIKNGIEATKAIIKINKNALIILLSLFDDNPADLYSNLGTNGKKLSKREKEDIFSKLKKEFFLKQREKRFNKLLRKIKESKGD